MLVGDLVCLLWGNVYVGLLSIFFLLLLFLLSCMRFGEIFEIYYYTLTYAQKTHTNTYLVTSSIYIIFKVFNDYTLTNNHFVNIEKLCGSKAIFQNAYIRKDNGP